MLERLKVDATGECISIQFLLLKGGFMREYLSQNEFERLRDAYKEENDSYEESILFHVGTEAGFYSEVGSMLECMCFCHLNKYRFILYADDANFTSGRGWEAFFTPFCGLNHDNLNRTANKRRCPQGKVMGWKRKRLLKRSKATYLTDDFFGEFISQKFKETKISWPLFGMDGTVYPEMSKLMKLALRYNEETYGEVLALMESVRLPEHYMSIQIRGGDKIEERTKLYGAKECAMRIKETGTKVKDLFVFTDDYRNIEMLRMECPEWNIYTLARETEKGYSNGEFNRRKWEEKRKDLVKLFAMVEICINSDLHFGNEHSCANNIIMNCKLEGCYIPVVLRREDLRERG